MRAFLEGLYLVYNRRELVNPDPLAFLYEYDDPLDREIAGLVASCLAYGRVAQILKSVGKVLSPLGRRPHRFLLRGRLPEGLFGDFRHRFTTGKQVRELLIRVSEVLRSHGSLEAFMKQCARDGDFLEALNLFSRELSPSKESFPSEEAPLREGRSARGSAGGFSLLAAPENGSACKRLALYLKWMVRRDEVDPGGWTVFSPRDLLVPTDTHMHGIALRLGLTARKQADLKTALEITRAFARFCPEDPARYDFALTRFGIRGALRTAELADLYFGGLVLSCPPAGLSRANRVIIDAE
ncbi:MAG: TIGR02757 family protein [Synergistaceae bacterium]|nr:TIGR02757 family protein [Synergistaceae bacterium]